MSFVRDWNNGESYAVVGLAMGSDQNITVGGVRNGRYTDAVTGGEIDVGSGTISFSVPANSAGIWVLNGPGRIGDPGCHSGLAAPTASDVPRRPRHRRSRPWYPHERDVGVVRDPLRAREIDARLADSGCQIGMDFQDRRAIQRDDGCDGIVAPGDADERNPYGCTIQHPRFIVPRIEYHAVGESPLKNLPVGSATDGIGGNQTCATSIVFAHQLGGFV